MSRNDQFQLSLDHDPILMPPGLPHKRLLVWLGRRRSSWRKDLSRWSLSTKSRDSISISRDLTKDILLRCQSVKTEYVHFVGILNVSQISRNASTAEQGLRQLVYSEVASLQLLGSEKEVLDYFLHERDSLSGGLRERASIFWQNKSPFTRKNIMLQIVNSQQVIPFLAMGLHYDLCTEVVYDY